MKSNTKKFLPVLLTIIGLSVAVCAFAQNSTDTASAVLSKSYPALHNSGSLADFPKLHPLVVHVPIMFLILAFILQLFSFAVYQRAFSWVVLGLTVTGFIGAYLASGIFHGGDPNLPALDAVTRATFEKHELYASYTVWISGFAAAAKIISHFFVRKKRVAEIIVTLLLAASAVAVTLTGDMGARLVHIDGVGVQGRDLPAHDDM